MTDKEKSITVAKLYLTNRSTENYFYQLKGLFNQKSKKLINDAIFATSRANKFLESLFNEYAENHADNDIEALDIFINASVNAENSKRQLEFQNDLYKLQAKYK